MKRILEATGLLMPPLRWLAIYWAVSLLLMLLVSFGLEATDDHSGTFWGIKLSVQFGFSSQKALESAYFEMMRHVWLLLTLPVVCFIFTRKLVDTFRSDFTQFLRFSRSPCLFIETSRLAALSMLVLTLVAPFVVGSFWGLVRPGMDLKAVGNGILSCAGPTLFVATLIYLLLSLGFSTEIAKGCGLVMPFFLSGIANYLEKLEYESVNRFVPPGLPYSVTEYNSPNLRAGVVFCMLVAAGRLLFAARTVWLRAP